MTLLCVCARAGVCVHMCIVHVYACVHASMLVHSVLICKQIHVQTHTCMCTCVCMCVCV